MRRWLWVYVLIFLIAAGFRFSSYMQRSLWFDEAIEFWTAKVPTSELLFYVKQSLRDPPLYSILLHLWLRLGESEFFLRVPSVLFSLAGIVALMAWGVREVGWQWGWLPAWGLALAESDIRFAQEVGQYIFATAFIAWSLFFLNEFYRRDSQRALIAWMICTTLAIYTYYGSGISLPITVGFVFLYLLKEGKFRQILRLIFAIIGVAIAVLPLLLFWLPVQFYRGLSIEPTIPPLRAIFCKTVEEFPSVFKDYILHEFLAHTYRGCEGEPGSLWIVWLPVLLLIGWGAYRSRLAWIFTAWAGGIFLYYEISVLKLYPFGGRYSLVFSPHFWMCLGLSIAYLMQGKIAHKILGMGATIALLIANIKIPGYPPEDLNTMAKIWLNLRDEKDTTYVYYGAVPSLQHKLSRLAPRLYSTEGLVPGWYDSCWQGKAISGCRLGNLVYGKWIREMTPEQKKQEILAAVGYPRKFWFIASHIMWSEMSDIYRQLSRDYNFTRSYVSNDAALFLLERKTIPPSRSP